MTGASFRENLASIRADTTEPSVCQKSADRQTDGLSSLYSRFNNCTYNLTKLFSFLIVGLNFFR